MISIRKACPEDSSAISTIIIAAIEETNVKDYPASVIAGLPESFSPAQIAERMLARDTYVSVADEKITGTASLDKNTVRSVFVKSKLQGCGIGLALMIHLEELALLNGISELTVPSSVTAEGFYRKLGYRKVREDFEGIEKIIIMRKPLSV